MIEKKYNDLFYLCSLIEFIGRETKNKGTEIVNILGYDELMHIFKHAEVYHCERIESVADEYINDFKIKTGQYDQVAKAENNYPTHWDLGKIYMRLIRDISEDDDLVKKLIEVYNSWIVDSIENYNSAFYYMPPGYIKACYEEEEVLEY